VRAHSRTLATGGPKRYAHCLMADTPKPPADVQLQIQIDEAVANGQYVNMALVNHSDTEFTLDFIYVQPQGAKATVRSRIITNPKHMKRLLLAMQENLERYESRYGPIVLREDEGPKH
jgi:hypothetical protein